MKISNTKQKKMGAYCTSKTSKAVPKGRDVPPASPVASAAPAAPAKNIVNIKKLTAKEQSYQASVSDWKKQLAEEAKELRATGADNIANPSLEIALVMDCTSSMSSWISRAKETLNDVIDSIIEECKNEGNLQVRVCFVGYRDIRDSQRFRVLPFTDNIESVRKFISESKAEGGDDLPEDLQGGLKLALQQDWTQEASKRVFLVCDAPCHGKQYHSTSDDYPNGSPDGLELEHLLRDFCLKEIEF